MTDRHHCILRNILLVGGLLGAGAAHALSPLVQDDLLTGSNSTTPWQECGSDQVGVDVSQLDAGGCAYRTTPAEPGITYTLTCGVNVVKFASLTLAFLDADDNELASDNVQVTEHQSGAYSVTLQSPAGTATAAVGIYGENGSGFQDCVLVDSTPPVEPTRGSIAGISWFDDSGDSVLDSAESPIAGTIVQLFSNGVMVDQTTTGSQGEYSFGGLDIDQCYTVNFTGSDTSVMLGAPGGDNDIVNGNATAPICLTVSAPDVPDVDVAFVATPPVEPPADYAICGVTWVDENGNGTYDGNDSIIGNVRVRLVDTATGVVSRRANADGTYVFSGLTEGTYYVRIDTPDGHTITTMSGSVVMGGSYLQTNGNTPIINIPADGNTPTDSACTVEHINGGFVPDPIVIPPTVANDDSSENIVGIDFGVEVISNDETCQGGADEGSIHEVNLLGHNVPGNVAYDSGSGSFMISDTTAAGTYTIEYGIRGGCGSYDTATVTIVLEEPAPVVSATAPDAPECRVETGGSNTIGGIDVIADNQSDFASAYNFYDRHQNLIITVYGNNYSHQILRNWSSLANQPYFNRWETEWTGSHYGFNQFAVYYVSAVENGEESALTHCVRHNISPIALDLENRGRIRQIQGDFQVDLSGDGNPEALSTWFAPTAGILLSKSVEGQVSGEHLFGNVEGVYADGFAELATLDSNNDGQVSGKELEGLLVWTDLDSDTLVEAGEVSSLADHQIVSLAVNHYKFMARATKSNGKTILMEDVWLSLTPVPSMASTDSTNR